MNRFQLIRLDARAIAAVAAVLLLTVAGPTLVFAEDPGGDVVDAAGADDIVGIDAVSDAADGAEVDAPLSIDDTDVSVDTDHVDETVDTDDADETVDTDDADETVVARDTSDAVDGAKSREELLEEWDALNQERQRLLEELQTVHRDMQAVAGELWDYELEEARQRIREQLNEYGGDYGEDIIEWLPPRLIDHIAGFTGRTPDELRDMVREGEWGDLF